MLAKKMILGKALTDKHVRCIEPDGCLVFARKANKVKIFCSFSKEAIAAGDDEDKIRHGGSVKKIAEMRMIPPYFEAFVLAMKKAAGTYVLEPCPTDCVKTTMFVAKGIVEIIPNRPFYLMVTSLSKLSIIVPKHTKLAELT